MLAERIPGKEKSGKNRNILRTLKIEKPHEFNILWIYTILRRQRSQVQILSGAPILLTFIIVISHWAVARCDGRFCLSVNTLPDLIFKATKSGAQTTGWADRLGWLAGWLAG